VQEMWGHGFTTEIARRLMEHAGAQKVIARCDPENEASLKVLGKLGFRVVSTEGGTVHLIASERPSE
jgi:RimJ/RimL family protein N-acetyltransferase